MAGITIIAIIILIPFSVYIWNDPDDKSCFVNEQTNQASIEPLSDADENVADNWQYWFKFNFIATLTIALFAVIIGI